MDDQGNSRGNGKIKTEEWRKLRERKFKSRGVKRRIKRTMKRRRKKKEERCKLQHVLHVTNNNFYALLCIDSKKKKHV